MKLLLVFAMPEESQDVFTGYDVLHTQIGKVNAAYSLTQRIVTARPDIVVNMGTAGSRRHAGGCVINPTRFIQRDMDVSVLGVPEFQTPFSNDPIELHYGTRFDHLPDGVCGTGDNFDASDAANNYDVVDMEAYALALICQRENIPFACLKYVSDGADGDANADWNETLHHAAEVLKDALKGSGL